MMILIMLVVALLLFLINEGDPRLIARSILGPYAQDQQLDAWVIENGYDRSVIVRYFEWLGRIFAGDLGESVIYKRPVSEIFWDRSRQHRHPRWHHLRHHGSDRADAGRAGGA